MQTTLLRKAGRPAAKESARVRLSSEHRLNDYLSHQVRVGLATAAAWLALWCLIGSVLLVSFLDWPVTRSLTIAAGAFAILFSVPAALGAVKRRGQRGQP